LLGIGSHGWEKSAMPAVRGVTLGPIESSLHPGKGYGSEVCARALAEARELGANWVSLTPFGRVWDTSSTGVSLSFEQPYRENRRAVARAVAQAHAAGLRVMLVPHLWVESGGWRGEMDPGGDEDWAAWVESYGAFLRAWAELARDSGVQMLVAGVELRSWVTTARAPSFVALLREIRRIYPGLVTYAANWDDVVDTVILGELDVIGVNAFYPLAHRPGATVDDLLAGSRKVAQGLRELSHAWGKPVLFTEFGYTTRRDPALRPWEWPENLSDVVVDEKAQADAYRALVQPLLDEPWFAGLFLWRLYADPDDVSQEPEWGFSPRGKLAEGVLREAFAAHFAADGPRPLGASLHRHSALRHQ
jgi:hypothetical protein